MNQMMLRTATLTDRALIRSISERTWPSTYGHIISQEQIDFMLDWMYSNESLAGQFEKGHQFFIAQLNGSDIGFCSVSAEPLDETGNIQNAYKLNKLYVLPAALGPLKPVILPIGTPPYKLPEMIAFNTMQPVST